MSKRASLKFFKMATAETLTAPARLSRDPRADGHALSTTRGCRAAGLQTPCLIKKLTKEVDCIVRLFTSLLLNIFENVNS